MSEEIEFEAGTNEKMRGFLALPEAAEQPAPALLVIHEIIGLGDDMRSITERFAEAGYVALAPNLYSGSGPRPLCVMRTLRTLAKREGPALASLESARAWLAERPEVDASRIGVAGFCMGGGFALMLAVRAPLGAAAVFYGDVPKRAEDLDGTCPVVGGFGARDRVFGPAGERLKGMLDELGVDHDVVLYPEAGHSYMSHHGPILSRLGALSPMRTGYDDEAARDSWRRMLAFFNRHLG
ncbi:MAG: dienelactone hydrolase family protein [Deltaproteobacteria bacterium]|nr:dienelactone hydrolase family protein [Deltaproteobacteria bacterium]MBW2392728.1 dienelactone hydrolase family protein [Deltaproteobacteria bacterium]